MLTIVDRLKQEGLASALEPWLYVHTRDRLAWVCLNHSKPLSKVVDTSARRTPAGHFIWDWGLLPYYDLPNHPWRMYIPLRSDSLRDGTHSWVFRKLSEDSQLDPSRPSSLLRLHPQLKKNILLTFRAARYIYTSVINMYGFKLDTKIPVDPTMGWMDEDYREETTLNSRLWDHRRMVLELYGWASYHLLRDSQDWTQRNWDDGFVGLVQNLRILTAPRRGCIIDPLSTQLAEVVTMVRHGVPVHYQWKGRNSGMVVGGWVEPTGEAAQFDPYTFEHAYDYAAFMQAGGDYDNTAMNRCILGRPSANALYREFILTKHVALFRLPSPPEGKVKKNKTRYFAREFVGGRLTEITKQAMTNLINEEAGKVYREKRASGDMQLLTKVSLRIPQHGLDLQKFFVDYFDGVEHDVVTCKATPQVRFV